MPPATERTEPITPAGALLRLDPQTGVFSERAYTLTVVDGPDRGRVVPLTRVSTIGTDPEADLALTDTTVSRRHVELHPRADGVSLRDLASTNGVYVGGARVTEALIEAETVLGVGRTKVRLSFVDQAVPPSSASASPGERFGELVGRSAAMQSLFRILERVAPASSNVVLLGETGTGKDVVARSIHEASPRAAGPFVVFDCAAVSPALIESELFGHARGSFTGAHAARPGAFELANGGTIFLDEIGELPLELQPRLLRVLEVGTTKRVGETGYRQVDVRVIAATHRNLEADVVAGRFRSDLFYRLSVMVVRVPPLRERAGDVPLLVEHFAQILGSTAASLPQDVLTRFEAHAWPGNVRELRNEIERALVLPTEPDVRAPSSASGGPSFEPERSASPSDARRARIEQALARRAGNQKLAAQDLGISRRTLLNWLDELGLPRPRKPKKEVT